MKKIAILTNEILGPYIGGGIATSVFGLLAALKNTYHCTVIYGGPYRAEWDAGSCKEFFARMAVDWIDLRDLPHIRQDKIDNTSLRSSAWFALEQLKILAPDLAIFHDYQGLGYYSTIARQNGSALSATNILTVMHGPSQWATGLNRQIHLSPERFSEFHMERRQCELSDWVSSPSQYIFDWARSEEWQLDPKKHSVERNILPLHHPQHYLTRAISKDPGLQHGNSKPQKKTEITFFGRSEIRKGIYEFCNALDLMDGKTFDAPELVTFLGKPADINGVDSSLYIIQRSKKWPFRLQFLEDLSQAQALAHISQDHVLAVIPSFAENAPCVVVEALRLGVDFLASLAGGTAELIPPGDRDHIALPLERWAMAKRLSDRLKAPHRAVKPSYSHQMSIKAWRARIAALLEPDPLPQSPAPARQPKVSVIVTHFNRPAMLAQSLKALAKQSYKNLEIIVVDDGSDSDQLRQAQSLMAAYPKMKFLQKRNGYLGAARNAGAKIATGEYLKFQDDDNISLPHEVETLLRAAENTSADLVTCFSQFFSGTSPPEAKDIQGYYLPLGDGALPALFDNDIGDANALLRKSSFDEAGGFSEDYGIGFEDYELFLKLLLRQKRITLVPEPLFWYRVNSGSMLQHNQKNAALRLLSRDRIARLFRAGGLTPEGALARDLARFLISTHFNQSQPDLAANRDPRPRDEQILRAFVENGRLPEAISFLKSSADPALIAHIAQDLLGGKALLSGSQTLSSDNLVQNPLLEDSLVLDDPAPYSALCRGWVVPRRAKGLTVQFSPITHHGGVDITLRHFNPQPDDYLLLRAGLDCARFAQISGFQLALHGAALAGPNRLSWFIRVKSPSGFQDYTHEIALSPEAAPVATLTFPQPIEIRPGSACEFFLSLLGPPERHLHLNEVSLRCWGNLRDTNRPRGQSLS